MTLIGGIEAGGTKFVCAVGTGPGDIQDEIRFPTDKPEIAIAKSIAFFRNYPELEAIGIASFGPVDPDPSSPTFGFVTTTPKPGWANTNFAGQIQQALKVPVGFDTDVNGAALGEYKWGAAQGLSSCVYLTVGTGIGGGAVVEGKLLHGLLHPEMGHMRILHDTGFDPYPGYCSYHGDCLEGLACGPAIEQRWGKPGQTLPLGHPAWQLEAHYLALACVNIITILSPQRIILGGGVMAQEHLFPLIRQQVKTLLKGYISKLADMDALEDYIVAPKLGAQAGVLGAIALGQSALE